MSVPSAIRGWCAALLLALLAPAWMAGAQAAEAKPHRVTIVVKPGQNQAEIETAIRAAGAAGGEVTIVWADAASPGSGAKPGSGTDVPGAAAPAAAATSPLGLFQAGLAIGFAGIRRIPEAVDAVAKRFDAAASGHGGPLLWQLALVLVLCAGTAFAGRALLRVAIGHLPRPRDDTMARARSAMRAGLVDLLAIGLFFLLGWSAMTMWLQPTGFAQRVCGDLVKVAAFAGAIIALGRVLLAPPAGMAEGGAGQALVPIPHPAWHRTFLNAYGIIGLCLGTVVFWSQLAGAPASASEGVFLLGATFLTILKLVWFGLGRRDIAALFAGSAPGPVRRVLAWSAPWLFIAIALLIWVVGCMAAISPQAAHWGAAAGATQILVLVVPILALGIDALLKAALAQDAADATPLRRALRRGGRSLVAGGVWIAGLWAILLIWRSYLVDESALSTLALLQSTLKMSVALVVGWAALRFLRTWFSAYAPNERLAMPGDEQAEDAHPGTRLSTILPLFRDMLLGVVIAVTGLIVLSSIGVDIAPLLAGFGVIGLALSFGSQALVRDIVAGIFFIADDAFRVGEYLDTGRHKGTVERISLRSLRLRHQNGQIHTVPFGQIQAITNFSRDWNTVKFELRFEPDADVDAIRKVVKKIGLGLLEDPELGPQFLQPLKLQGIQELTPNAMVVRLKFSARPGNPAALQREAVKRLLPALRQANLPLASNAVTVRSGTPEAAAASLAAEAAQAQG